MRACISCANWERLDDDHSIGVCHVHNGYRFQFEDCPNWTQGDRRAPYKEKEASKKERNKSRDEEIERLILSGHSMGETRRILHCDYALVKAVVTERGLKTIPKKHCPKRQIITGEAYDRVVNYYKEEGKSKQWIASKMGFTLAAVRGALVREGLAK